MSAVTHAISPGVRPEPDPLSGCRPRRHELSDRLKYDLELCVVLRLQLDELPREIGVGREHLAEPDERAHDLDVHPDGAGAPEDARQHRDALLREGVGCGAPATTPGF